MNTNDEQWWDAQCGEYVLGTLRGVERDVFDKILDSDSDAQVKVDFWKNYLSQLDNYIPATTPPEHLLPKIVHKIRLQDTNTQTPELRSSANEIHDLTSDWSRDLDETLDANNQRSAVNAESTPESHRKAHRKSRVRHAPTRLWKTLSLISIATAIALAALLFLQLDSNKQQSDGWQADRLSIVQDSEQKALWLITLYKDTSQATVIALAPPPVDSSQRHQLWMLHPEDGRISPLGQLPEKTGDAGTIEMSAADYQDSVFTVSVETATNATLSAPTGPVLYSGKIQSLEITELEITER